MEINSIHNENIGSFDEITEQNNESKIFKNKKYSRIIIFSITGIIVIGIIIFLIIFLLKKMMKQK